MSVGRRLRPKQLKSKFSERTARSTLVARIRREYRREYTVYLIVRIRRNLYVAAFSMRCLSRRALIVCSSVSRLLSSSSNITPLLFEGIQQLPKLPTHSGQQGSVSATTAPHLLELFHRACTTACVHVLNEGRLVAHCSVNSALVGACSTQG